MRQKNSLGFKNLSPVTDFSGKGELMILPLIHWYWAKNLLAQKENSRVKERCNKISLVLKKKKKKCFAQSKDNSLIRNESCSPMGPGWITAYHLPLKSRPPTFLMSRWGIPVALL